MVFMVNGASLACGPYFDDAYIVRGTKDQFLSVPEGHFLYEIERIAGRKKEEPEKTDKAENSADKDALDLEIALSRTDLSEGEKQKALASYAEARSKLLYYLKTYPVEKPWIWYGASFRRYERGGKRRPFSFAPGFRLADEIPDEFALYIKGAVAYHNNNFESAIKTWDTLLKLPEEKRRYKSVWAAFMIGKTYLSMRDSGQAINFFEMTRQLASKGYEDSLDLAYESYGWQALAEYENKEYISSINNYVKQLDLRSLNWLCHRIFGLDDDIFEKVVEDEVSRKVLIGWAVSKTPWTYWRRTIDDNPSKNIYHKLLRAIETMDSGENIDNAGRIAWIFYNNGDFEGAKKWLKISGTRSPLTRWIESKLLLREGRVEEALARLKGLLPLFEKNQEWNIFYNADKKEMARMINTEIGVLQLSRQDYIGALQALIDGGACWEDIAYVAEKVLTTEELEGYLSKARSRGLSVTFQWKYPSSLEDPTAENALKYLLSRRFAREGKWQEALKHMPSSFNREWEKRTPTGKGYAIHEQRQETFDPKSTLSALRGYINNSDDKRLSKSERAKNYYEAALIMRKYGMELLGTELDPDWFVFNGQYNYDDSVEQRFAILNEERRKHYKGWYDEAIEQCENKRREILKHRDFFVGSEDEEKRAISSLPTPLKRFHYRYRAADLMWQCAQLLPDNDELKAKALCIGGTFLKVRDPQAADKFYKELVNTCGKTKIGREADELRWFPKIEDTEL